MNADHEGNLLRALAAIKALAKDFERVPEADKAELGPVYMRRVASVLNTHNYTPEYVDQWHRRETSPLLRAVRLDTREEVLRGTFAGYHELPTIALRTEPGRIDDWVAIGVEEIHCEHEVGTVGNLSDSTSLEERVTQVVDRSKFDKDDIDGLVDEYREELNAYLAPAGITMRGDRFYSEMPLEIYSDAPLDARPRVVIKEALDALDIREFVKQLTEPEYPDND